MAVGIYADVHIPRPITAGLRRRGVDVLTAQQDGMSEASDEAILDRASSLNRIVFTHDNDFLRETARRMKDGIQFSGVVFAKQLNISIGRCIDDIDLIAKSFEVSDLVNRVEYIPY